MNTAQVEMVSIDQLVSQNHTYRKMKKHLDFERITKSVTIKESEAGAIGFGKTRLVTCLIYSLC
ncbi:MAG: hypothetical protein FWF18_05435 [Dehalococcoidia bacterium]|nr:hypothetical protein [Dehalococcoidia bacterium]